MKVGFVGLGHMGSGMAASKLKAGHEVIVYNRTRAKAEPLIGDEISTRKFDFGVFTQPRPDSDIDIGLTASAQRTGCCDRRSRLVAFEYHVPCLRAAACADAA